MKVFIAEDVLSDYASGIIIIQAKSKKIALERIEKEASISWEYHKEEVKRELRELKKDELIYLYGGG